MNFERGDRMGRGGRGYDTDGYCPHLTDAATETLRDSRGGGHRLYETWGKEHKKSFRECITPPVNGSLKPGIDVKKVDALPLDHPARTHYCALDIVCAWEDLEIERRASRTG